MKNAAAQPLEATILVIDDTVASLRLFSTILTNQGYKVLTAPSGPAALQTAVEESPDLILLDINMPDMDGYEVCQRLKEYEGLHATPVLFISGMNDVLDKVKAFSAGGVDYITKPFQVEEVLARVRTHLTLHALQNELEQRVEARTAELQQKSDELEEFNLMLKRFVPSQFLELLNGKDGVEVKLTDLYLKQWAQREMTVMFADIRNFTTLSEKMDPQENFNFITSYLARVTPAIRLRGGFVDKYMGDGVMALFPGRPQDAIEAALIMRKVLEIYNRHRSRLEYPAIDIGTGLHWGELILGITGEAQRWEGTVISDAVNLASRLEGLTKFFGASIVVSEETLDQVDLEKCDLSLDDELRMGEELEHEAANDLCDSRRLARVQVKGKRHVVSVHEILYRRSDPSLFDLKVETKPDFEEGLDLYYARDFAMAAVKFKGVLDRNPEDVPARLFLERSARYMVHEVPEAWSGVEEMHDK